MSDEDGGEQGVYSPSIAVYAPHDVVYIETYRLHLFSDTFTKERVQGPPGDCHGFQKKGVSKLSSDPNKANANSASFLSLPLASTMDAQRHTHTYTL